MNNNSITIINDKRTLTELKNATLSGYKKTDVKRALLKSLFNAKLEESCYWCAELICCGAFIELWDIITIFMGKYVHLANVKLPIYLNIRYITFKNIIITEYLNNEISMRNDIRIRELFIEIMVVLCNSSKKHNIERSKVKKEELNIFELKERLKAPNINYANNSFKENDPKEFFIPINEFAFHISMDSRNMLLACFWLEWILEFETICKKKKEKCVCQPRDFVSVDDRLTGDIIWMLWDTIKQEANKRQDKDIINKILDAIISLFSIRYTTSSKSKRIYLIYFSIALLTEHYIYKNEVINNRESIDIVKKRSDMFYKEIKKNEINNMVQNKDEYKDKMTSKLEMMFGNKILY